MSCFKKLKDISSILRTIPQIMWNKMKYGGQFKCSWVQLWTGCVDVNMKKNTSISIGRRLFQRGNLHLITEQRGSINIGNYVFINYNVSITSLFFVKIEDFVKIANNVVIVDHNHNVSPNEFVDFVGAPVYIKKGAWIGANAVILKGVTIGVNSVVGAGSVVTKDVPAGEL